MVFPHRMVLALHIFQ